MTDKKLRLGLDIGANSIGWCLYHTDNDGEITGVVGGGSRIFTDERKKKDLSSTNVERRAARSMRRGFARRAQRQRWLLNALAKAGLFPAKGDGAPDLESEQAIKLQNQDPLKLRALAAESAEALAKVAGETGLEQTHLVGRALFHLNQQRGYKSNAKIDDENDAKVVGKARDELNTARGNLTVGQYLSARHQKGKPTRARPAKTANGKVTKYEPLYPFRGDLLAEFEQIWQAQQAGSDGARDEIRDIIFNQRDLKDPVVGACPFYPDDLRTPQALPSFQQFRILQDLNNMEYTDNEGVHSLSGEAREEIHRKLLTKKTVKFDEMRKILGDPDAKFNLERPVKRTRGRGKDKTAPLDEKPLRQTIRGDVVGYHFNIALRSKWNKLAADGSNLLAAQDEFVSIILQEDESKARRSIAQKWNFLTEEEINDCIKRISKLPKQRARFGARAIREIVPYLRESMHLDKAIDAAQEDGKLGGKKQRDNNTPMLPFLPRYQNIPAVVRYCAPRIPAERDKKESWRIPNPTVHIGLNQLRLLVNDIIRIHGKHGTITEIAMEILRDWPMGPKRRLAQNNESAANRDNNERISAVLKERRFAGADPRDHRRRILKYLLWEELAKNPQDRKCVYCGTPISVDMLFNRSVEIEHILPFSETLDNSRTNKTLACSACNKVKGKRAPYPAKDALEKKRKSAWDDILSRASKLPHAKFKRFQKDALEKYKFDRDGFLPRHLPESQYLSRVAMQYLKAIVGENKVYVVPGRTTDLLRQQWGLDSILSKDGGKNDTTGRTEKNRADHRHHAIDAAIVGATTRGMLQKVATVAAKEDDKRFLFASNVPQPIKNFRKEIDKMVDKIFVSHKPNRRREGQLHEKTAYGIVDNTEKVTHRVAPDKIVESAVKHINGKKASEKIQDIMDNDSEDPQGAIVEYLAKQNPARYIRDSRTRNAILTRIADAILRGENVKDALTEYLVKKRNLRSIQLLEPMSAIPIGSDKFGNPYKAYKTGGNWAYQIFAVPDGKGGEKWSGEIITTFDANQYDRKAKKCGEKIKVHTYIPRWRENPDAEFVMSIHTGDMIALDDEQGKRKIFRVKNISENDIELMEHFQAKVDKRFRINSIERLCKHGARKIHISPAGLINDPGPPPTKKK